MGLLDAFNTDEGRQALGLLAAAGPSMQPMNLASRMAMAGQSYQDSRTGALRQSLLNAQLGEVTAQTKQREVQAAKEQEALDRAKRLQAAIPGLYQGGGMSGGEAMPQRLGGQPMFSQPMGVSPMQSTPGGFDVQRALALGLNPDEITKYAGLTNLGRAEVARTIEQDNGRGGKETVQFDKFGQRVGAGLPGYIAPVQVNQGDKVSFLKPTAGVSVPVGMSPAERDSSARGWAGIGIQREQANSGKVPSGYRPSADGSGLEFIPGGPADPAAAKKAAPTEFQGKSTTFGARMVDAAKIIDELDGKVSPANVARSGYRPEFPGWVPGGQIFGSAVAAGNKLTVPNDAQRYAQAQENWVTANLRQESGAAIGKDEMAKDIAKWFPVPGEPKAIIEQKAAARKVAERAMVVQAGPGASAIQGIVEGGGSPPTQTGGGADWEYINGKLVKVKK